jgi:ethanolamine utilization protein EutN
MRIAEVIGTVTLSALHPSMEKARLRLAMPLSMEELLAGEADASSEAEPVVVYDDLGAGQGSWIVMAEGPEAAQPLSPRIIPLDAYNAAIIDRLDLERPE